MTPPAALARCTARGCPVRWRDGPDRPCADHDGGEGDLHAAAAELGIELPPDGRGRAAATPGRGQA